MSDEATPIPLQYLFPTGVEVLSDGVGALRWPEGAGPFGQQRVLQVNPHIATVHCQPMAMSAEECAAVVALGAAQPSVSGRVELGAEAYRVSHISWIVPDDSNAWLFHKVGSLFAGANQAYGFELTGLVDALQFTEYGPGEWFEWHMDIGRDETSLRKLSLTVQLSDGSEYEGGDLEFVSLAPGVEARQRGAATYFPSYMGHRVTPVTRGVRRSLVAWAGGAPFR